jgi:hypothetical protein
MLRILFRVPKWVWWVIGSLLLGWLAENFIQRWLFLIVIYFPVLAATESLSRSERMVGFFVAKRNLVVTVTILLIVGFGFLLLAINQTETQLPNSLPLGAVPWELRLFSGFFLIGAVLGGLARQCFGRIVYWTLLENPRLGLHFLGTAIWTVMGLILVGIILPNPFHKTSASWFVWGIAFGMLIHKGTRWWFDKRRKTQRLLRNIVDVWPIGDKATRVESKALELLVLCPSNSLT